MALANVARGIDNEFEPKVGDVDLARRFSGTARLYGHAAAGFQTAHVAVIGLGGVGSWAAEALARSGIGHLTLVDLDHVSESNINRQIHALDGELGRAKVEAMADRIALINPTCQVNAVDDFLTADNVHALLASSDAVIDAVDDVRAKAAMAVFCRAEGKFLLICGGAGGKRDLTRLKLGDLADVRNDPLLAKLRSKLRREHNFPRGDVGRRIQPLGLLCAYIDEPLANTQGGVDGESDSAATPTAGGLNCAGFGSAMHITAGIGLLAVGQVLQWLATSAPRSTKHGDSDSLAESGWRPD